MSVRDMQKLTQTLALTSLCGFVQGGEAVFVGSEDINVGLEQRAYFFEVALIGCVVFFIHSTCLCPHALLCCCHEVNKICKIWVYRPRPNIHIRRYDLARMRIAHLHTESLRQKKTGR